MKTPAELRRRLAMARSRLREYEGRLEQLQGHLDLVRGHARKATGDARVRLARLERELRASLDTAFRNVDRVARQLEPQIRQAATQARIYGRGLRAGVKAGARRWRAGR